MQRSRTAMMASGAGVGARPGGGDALMSLLAGQAADDRRSPAPAAKPRGGLKAFPVQPAPLAPVPGSPHVPSGQSAAAASSVCHVKQPETSATQPHENQPTPPPGTASTKAASKVRGRPKKDWAKHTSKVQEEFAQSGSCDPKWWGIEHKTQTRVLRTDLKEMEALFVRVVIVASLLSFLFVASMRFLCATTFSGGTVRHYPTFCCWWFADKKTNKWLGFQSRLTGLR